MHLYRNFSSQEEIDAEYNIGAALPGWESYLTRYIDDSKATRAALVCELDVPFGPTLDEHLDIFPASQPSSPIMLFIHGGYWRALSSKEFSFLASTLVDHGITVAVSNYTLCPKASIAEITRQSRAALAWLFQHAEKFNADPNKIYVSGHSAGGHLCAMVCSTDWEGEYGLPANLIKGGIPISGVFELEPLRYSYLQPVLRLEYDLIREQSPLLNIPAAGPPLLLSVGEKESAEFHRQSQSYQDAWRGAGMRAEYQVEPGHDHFSILFELLDPASPLFKKVISMITSTD